MVNWLEKQGQSKTVARHRVWTPCPWVRQRTNSRTNLSLRSFLETSKLVTRSQRSWAFLRARRGKRPQGRKRAEQILRVGITTNSKGLAIFNKKISEKRITEGTKIRDRIHLHYLCCESHDPTGIDSVFGDQSKMVEWGKYHFLFASLKIYFTFSWTRWNFKIIIARWV